MGCVFCNSFNGYNNILGRRRRVPPVIGNQVSGSDSDLLVLPGASERWTGCRARYNTGLDTYGSLYNTGSMEVAVSVPGGEAPISFSDALIRGGISYEQGEAAVTVDEAGDYQIDFIVYYTSAIAAFASFVVESNEKAVPGGAFSRMLGTGYQIHSGSVLARLDAGDEIRLVFTAGIALEITLTGGDVSAVLNIKKLN